MAPLTTLPQQAHPQSRVSSNRSIAYPSHCKFFTNSWTWRYEEVLRAHRAIIIAQIQVDRDKYVVYTSLPNPYIWKEIFTMDGAATRFHAYERFERCSEVDQNEVAYLSPKYMGLAAWSAHQQRLLEGMSCGKLPFGLHNFCLPELKALVGLFMRPNRIVPNTEHARGRRGRPSSTLTG
ncbi:hypothetical protein M407DRAFT_32834 [Tulasnella calospora MUT 4182]|uniref:Uncharacterized protein n=1 Tax=Tulasnella calospora MUT 4182 TaxID=1051891 RepID=A0A0C3K7V1_9AGAM|nr:hypothetical protein M407DRAFT_32834 [Tulasnella calospora MUT 4182]